TEFFPAHAMMSLSIIGPVPEEPVNWQATNRLSDRGNKVRRIVARTVSHLQGGDQMAGMMRNDGQFGKTPEMFHPAGPSQKAPADVSPLQAGRVDRGLRDFLDQAAFVGNTENSGEEPFKSPFFRSRSCAF